MSKKSQVQRAEKRQLILAKAEQVFIRKGFNDVTMKDIIEECGISRGGIYLYFSTVDEIFIEVVKSHNKSKIDIIKSNIVKEKNFKELIEDYFSSQKKRLLNMDKSLKSAMMGFFLAHKDEYSQSFIAMQFDDSQNIMLEILRYGNKNNQVTESSLITMAENIMLFIEGISTIALFTGLQEEFIDEQFRYMKQIIYSKMVV